MKNTDPIKMPCTLDRSITYTAPCWCILEGIDNLPDEDKKDIVAAINGMIEPKKKGYVDPTTAKLVDLVRNNKKVKFLFYREKKFYYEQEDGFVFPISQEEADAGRATFLAEDKAIYYMRWMKRYIEECKQVPTGS